MVAAVIFRLIIFSLATFFLLSYLGASNDYVSDTGRMCFMVAMPIIAGSVVGFFMFHKPISYRFMNINISNYAIGAIAGAFVGAVILAIVLFLISLYTSYLVPSFIFKLDSAIFNSLVYGSFIGTPLGALGSTSVITRNYIRNLCIALVGGIGSLIFDPVNIHYYHSRPFLYTVGFPPLLATVLSFGLRYGKRKFESTGFSELSVLVILLSASWLGICLGIWLKLKVVSSLLILSASIGLTISILILLRYWFIHRKLLHRD
jgi:hypothetical protein